MARKRAFDLRTQTGFATVAMFTFFMLYLPMAALVVYAFNAGNSMAIWEGVSLRWFYSAASNERVQDAAMRSVVIATCAALEIGRAHV